MSAGPFHLLYANVSKSLWADTEVKKFITDARNIRPADDATEPQKGNLIVFGLINSFWDRKARRGSGILTLSCETTTGKIPAHQLIEACRNVLTPKTLTDLGGIRVHMFKERGVATDAGTSPAGWWQVGTQFDVRLVLAP
jgi:hypothetical protein